MRVDDDKGAHLASPIPPAVKGCPDTIQGHLPSIEEREQAPYLPG